MSKRKQMVETGAQANQVSMENMTLPSATDSGPTILLSPRNIYEKEETSGNKKTNAANAGRKSKQLRNSTNPSRDSRTRHMQTYEMVSMGSKETKVEGDKDKSKSPRTKLLHNTNK